VKKDTLEFEGNATRRAFEIWSWWTRAPCLRFESLANCGTAAYEAAKTRTVAEVSVFANRLSSSAGIDPLTSAFSISWR